MESCSPRRVEIGAREEVGIWRFEEVVIIRRESIDGRRAATRVARSDIGVEAGMGSERVGGRLSPGNEVRSTLIVLRGSIFAC
jgi:hypothetical protein